MPAKVKKGEENKQDAATDELCCTYAALILHDDNIKVTDDALNKILTAANVHVQAYYPGLFARVLSTPGTLDELILKGGAGAPAAGGAAAPAAAAGGAPAGKADDKKKEAPKKEEKKVESEEEDMGFGLFD
eukprot:TRINITY_DN11_c0_g2_i1.p1 TRINITY_DN11_c0_g2~~TRINITY_DN11_c0_g2_i1.p1  ORF type:complete len:146 (-),score=75.72 TRINITY_DN11_c0_g2_i1:55-447(-)